MAYRHIKAGANVLQGANLADSISLAPIGSASTLPSKHGRWYLGSSGVGKPNTANVVGPFVGEQIFVAGPEWLGPHNKHGALIAHAMFGGAHFVSHEFPLDAQGVNFYYNQIAPAPSSAATLT